MCLRRWRPCDRCVSFHHYLQGAPGRDGLKGEKVGKPQINFSPQRKKHEAVMLYHSLNMLDNLWRYISIYSACILSLVMLLYVFSPLMRTVFFLFDLYKYCAKVAKWKSAQLTCIFDGVCHLSKWMKPCSHLPAHWRCSVILQGSKIDLKCLSLPHLFTFKIVLCHLCHTDIDSDPRVCCAFHTAFYE